VEEDDDFYTAPPPDSPSSEASSSSFVSARPPPFLSLVYPPGTDSSRAKVIAAPESEPASLSPYNPPLPEEEPLEPDSSLSLVAETKASSTRDSKEYSPGKSAEEGEPPPPYTEGSSPIDSFTYVMAAAGGASSIITQVQQAGGPPINTLGGMSLPWHLRLST
jgi:dipeptidyl-peptidase-3